MKYILFFFIICGSVLSNDILEQIDNTRFGRSLLDTINLQLRSEQSVDDLLKVLDDMRDTMNEQKEQQEHEHQEFQQDCGKDIDFYQQEIAQAIVIVVDMQREIDQTNEEIKQIQSLLDQVYEQMKVYQQALTKLNEIRLEEAKEFKQTMDEHDITTTAIEESKRYFVQIRGEISFLQARKHVLAQVSSHFHSSKGLVKSHKYKALFNIMAQMTSKAQFDNAEIVAKILELCDRVLENVAESRLAEQEAENEKIAIFTEKKKILDDNIFKTQGKINTLEGQKKALVDHLNIVQGVFDDNSHRRDENTELMKSRKAECENEIAEYGTERGKDLEQIQTVEKIITITETQLATMKQYLGERREKSGVKVNMKV